ncbi:MAG: metallophosphoesterase family protein [Candidatus Hodarchaeales archaeon]
MSPIVRILFIADIHSNLEALQAVKKHVDFEFGTVDYTIGVGDLVGYGASPNEVCDLTKEILTACVMGNHDAACTTGHSEGFRKAAQKAAAWTHETLTVENKTYLSLLKNELRFNVNNLEFYLTHGSPRDHLAEYVLPSTPEKRKESFLEQVQPCSIMVLGHTHIGMLYRGDNGVILNPGSVGQPRDGDPRASAAILEVHEDGSFENVWLRVDYDITSAARKMREANLPHYLYERLFFGE